MMSAEAGKLLCQQCKYGMPVFWLTCPMLTTLNPKENQSTVVGEVIICAFETWVRNPSSPVIRFSEFIDYIKDWIKQVRPDVSLGKNRVRNNLEKGAKALRTSFCIIRNT